MSMKWIIDPVHIPYISFTYPNDFPFILELSGEVITIIHSYLENIMVSLR
jgi:hypothetical protein